MDTTELINQLYIILYATAILAGPPLIAATLLGLIVSIFQTVTQIQDQSLSQTIKIAAIALVLLFMGGLLAAPFYRATEDLFSDFPKLVNQS